MLERTLELRCLDELKAVHAVLHYKVAHTYTHARTYIHAYAVLHYKVVLYPTVLDHFGMA